MPSLRLPFALAAAALLLAGCSGTSTTSSTSSGGGGTGLGTQTGSQTVTHTGTASGAAPTPFTADKSGDLRGEDASGAWDWTVAPGFKTFKVTFEVDGLQGLPVYESGGYSYHLHGEGANGESEDQNQNTGGGGVSSQSGSPPGCVVCKETGDGFAGTWHFEFSLKQTVAHYTVHIETTY